MQPWPARRWLGLPLVLGLTLGCGTTRMTDTQRTATEQLLISNAVDQAVSQLDFRVLAGKPVFFDPQYLDSSVDRGYVVSSLRQHLLACGCILQEERSKATYVVEARTGGLGTDRHSLLLGIPQMTIPTFVPGLALPAQVPEIPFAKKTEQNGIAKLAVFAYNRLTGQPLCQSGVVESVSTAKDLWLLGAGPFEKGTIRSGTEFAGEPLPRLPLPGFSRSDDDKPPPPVIPVTQAAAWPETPLPTSDLKRLTGLSSLRAPGYPRTMSALIRAHAADLARNAGTVKLPALPPAASQSGGQAETQPARILTSGLPTGSLGQRNNHEALAFSATDAHNTLRGSCYDTQRRPCSRPFSWRSHHETNPDRARHLLRRGPGSGPASGRRIQAALSLRPHGHERAVLDQRRWQRCPEPDQP
jgi:hypothetical protein